MASPAVQTTAESATTTAATTHTVNLPSGIAAGDLLLILFATVGNTTPTASGWDSTTIVRINPGGSTHFLEFLFKKATGSEGASVSVSTGAASVRSASIAYRISGAIDPAAQAPERSTTVQGTSTAPNAATVTPTGGSKDFLFLTMFVQEGEEADDDTWVTGTPSGYSNLLQKTCGTAGSAAANVQLASAQKQATASSEDAGAFTTAQSLDWAAITLAIHPASAVSLPATDRRRRSMQRTRV